MFYKFDYEQLQLVRDFKKLYISLTTVLVLLLIMFIVGRLTAINHLTTLEKEMIVVDLANDKAKFTKAKLVDLLKELHVKHPHIVMAQSILETGHWNEASRFENQHRSRD